MFLKNIDYVDIDYPVYRGILEYLYSEKDLQEYGWRFSIPSNDNFPHAPWWNYDEEANKTESIGVTSGLSAFILKYADKSSRLYQKVAVLVNNLIEIMMADTSFGDMGINGFIELIDTLRELNFGEYDYSALQIRLNEVIKNSIEYDLTKWEYYGVRPSNYITTPQSIYYNENKEIIQKELKYLLDTRPDNGVWGITWSWFDNNEKYAKEFALSENWWKANKAIEKLRFLKNFSCI